MKFIDIFVKNKNTNIEDLKILLYKEFKDLQTTCNELAVYIHKQTMQLKDNTQSILITWEEAINKINARLDALENPTNIKDKI